MLKRIETSISHGSYIDFKLKHKSHLSETLFSVNFNVSKFREVMLYINSADKLQFKAWSNSMFYNLGDLFTLQNMILINV